MIRGSATTPSDPDRRAPDRVPVQKMDPRLRRMTNAMSLSSTEWDRRNTSRPWGSGK